MTIPKGWLRFSLWASIFLLGMQVAWGSVGGSISGLVKDPTGAVVAGAEVTAINTDTGVQHKAKTDAAGFYSFPSLPLGHYRVEINQSGFKAYRATNLVIDVNSALRVDATLELGAVTQEVSVSAAAVQVETTNTQMGEVIGTNKMELVPLNGRSYTDLLALQPGVVPQSSGMYTNSGAKPSGELNAGTLSVSGQRESSNGFMVNGGNVQEGLYMGTAIIPNLDSIAEFRILTNDADAEYGNYSGGLVNAITKSGTNKFHGDLFDFIRNYNMDSRNFFSGSRGTLHKNEFGGTIGGPIIHDRLFFFGDYQGNRQVIGVDSGLIGVPSINDKTGNLTDVASRMTGTVTGSYWASQLSQKLGYPVAVNEPYYTPGCTSSANCVFPNAQIPQSAWAAPPPKLMKYIPDPNSGSSFTTSAFDNILRDDKWSSRIDGNTRLGLISGYYFFDQYSLTNPYPVTLPGFSQSNVGRAQNVNLGVTKSFGASSVNEFRLSYVRNVHGSTPVGGIGVKLSDLGFVEGPGTLGIVPQQPPQYEGAPNISLNNFSFGTPGSFSFVYNNTYQLLDNYSKVVGTHTLKFGGAVHYDQITNKEYGESEGTFQFNGQETGSDFADFLLGAPSGFDQGVQIPFHTRTKYFGLYAQDSWRARPDLTLNLGLRWESSTPFYEAFNQMEALSYGQQSVVFPGSPKGWVFPGDPGIPRTIAPTRYKNYAPRIGLAYSPHAQGGFLEKLLGGAGKTSIRAAFGVYFTAFEDAEMFNAEGDAPFGFFYSAIAPPLFATPYVDRQTGFVEGQRFPVTFPPANASAAHPVTNIDWSQFLPISSSPVLARNAQLPYAEHYSLSLQRQFGVDSLLSISYVGTQSHRLLGAMESNVGNPALCMSVSQSSQVIAGGATCGPNGENTVYTTAAGATINGTRGPYGNAFGSNDYFNTMANSNYNALETSLRHTSGRSEFLAAYTYSKVLANSSSWGSGGDVINPINPLLSKSLAAFDVTHNFVVSYGYEIPFDKLWRANRLTRGWVISGITRFSTGLPVPMQEADDHSLLGTGSGGPGSNGVDEPNFLGGSLAGSDPRQASLKTHTNPYFNNALFSKEVIGTLGTANRRFFHGPGLNNWDLALMKDLRITESKKLEFRGEFFNLFNHAQFGLPSGNFLSSNFGFVTGANAARIGQVAIKLYF